jgi:hypothetical protein
VEGVIVDRKLLPTSRVQACMIVAAFACMQVNLSSFNLLDNSTTDAVLLARLDRDATAIRLP